MSKIPEMPSAPCITFDTKNILTLNIHKNFGKNILAWYMYLIINVEANFKTNYVESSTIGMGSLADRKAII